MTKQLSKIVAGGLLLLATSISSASLIPMSWNDSYQTKRWMNSYGETDTWTFNLNNDGFNLATDYVQNYKIRLYLGDDENDRPRNPFTYELAYFNQPGAIGDSIFEVDPGVYGVSASFAGRWHLNNSGTLTVSLTRLWGDFAFYGADLWARGTRNVPEPGLLSLLAFGLVGVGLARRRRTAKR